MPDIIVVEGLRKRFGDVTSLDGVDLRAAPGTVLGLLGPNGAGKTTLVRILATLLSPDAGRVLVGGHDVVAAPEQVRHIIGLSGQFTALDDQLTGAENLLLFGRLFRLGRRETRRRAADLIDRLELGEVAGRAVRTYSGGMRRRFDIAIGLIGGPAVLFLDEPTTGLDVRSRQGVWEIVRDLVSEGTTVLLTTHYLEEADQLADTVVVLDRGRVVACGVPAELKAGLDAHTVEVRVSDPAWLRTATEVAGPYGSGQRLPNRDDDEMTMLLRLPAGDTTLVPRLLADLYAAGVPVEHLVIRQPSLDDLVLSLTGGGATPTGHQSVRPLTEEVR
ncbi:daunorubicin resistance protein DrrA family ABC transporter ATP-binding protein [Micromonospora sonneratiae]|uniref:ATP-binding cassette domain-containing protein n=1 Tax=Micromonospora sonneratiae TaxID=1184706 RepID=A0ABW3YAX7_9ACTN